MERLEGGLEKLKSTAAQVDDLKEKLAAQEVELKQKNDDADALIKVVGIEQEKVSQTYVPFFYLHIYIYTTIWWAKKSGKFLQKKKSPD